MAQGWSEFLMVAQIILFDLLYTKWNYYSFKKGENGPVLYLSRKK